MLVYQRVTDLPKSPLTLQISCGVSSRVHPIHLVIPLDIICNHCVSQLVSSSYTQKSSI